MRVIKISADTSKCTGESKDKDYICDGRDYCLRYVAPANPYQVWTDFWKAGNDCANGISLTRDL